MVFNAYLKNFSMLHTDSFPFYKIIG